ncbi:MAG: hypothetical protein D6B26_07365, partial [Spirochaetaceae bacterium]
MYKTLVLVTLLICVVSAPVLLAKDSAVDLENPFSLLSLPAKVQVFSDNTAGLSLAQLPKDGWELLPADRLSFGYDAAVYWLRFAINVPSDGRKWLLQIDNLFLDEVFFYTLPSDALSATVNPELSLIFRQAQTQQSGYTLPVSQRSIPDKAIMFRLSPGEHVYYLRVASSSSISVPMKLVEEHAAFSEISHNRFFTGVLYG